METEIPDHDEDESPRIADYDFHFSLDRTEMDSETTFKIESTDYSPGWVTRRNTWLGTSYRLYCGDFMLQAYAAC